MKYLLIILLFSFSAEAQKLKVKRADLALGSVQFAAGIFRGIREQVLYHPNELFRQHPNLNTHWWDSRTSWTNKLTKPWWKPVGLTDANHFFQSAFVYSNILSIGISTYAITKDIFDNKKLRLWAFFKAMAISTICQWVGFYASYTLHFKNH